MSTRPEAAVQGSKTLTASLQMTGFCAEGPWVGCWNSMDYGPQFGKGMRCCALYYAPCYGMLKKIQPYADRSVGPWLFWPCFPIKCIFQMPWWLCVILKTRAFIEKHNLTRSLFCEESLSIVTPYTDMKDLPETKGPRLLSRWGFKREN